MIAGLEILNLHAQGGMAEVYRARGKGADGRTWHYAVKRILPELTQNAELRQMFIEEARVASLLVHKNIVRVYDLAKSEADELYIVMEFLEGRDLAEIVDQAIDLGRPLPVWLTIHVAREVLAALVYATTEARDRERRPLALIHRDISPHNIFVCFDGQIKLCDFGVAKVAQSSVLTQVGVTKGKFGYMSPEQLMSEKLDFRSDLYNVGILLYECLTGRKLFHGDNPSQFLQAMLKGEVPALDPSLRVPPELEALMRRALSKNRAARPESAAAFDVELYEMAERYNLHATHEHVAAELRMLYGSEIESCAVGPALHQPPKQLTSVHAAQPQVVARAPQAPQAPQVQMPAVVPQVVPAQERVRGLSDPSANVTLDADNITAPQPPAPGPRSATRPKQKTATGSAPRTGTRSGVRALDDGPATIPPESDPSTLPPEKPVSKRTVVVGGAGAKAIAMRVDDEGDWSDATSSDDQLFSVRGVVTRSSRVVPLAPKKKRTEPR